MISATLSRVLGSSAFIVLPGLVPIAQRQPARTPRVRRTGAAGWSATGGRVLRQVASESKREPT
jgi:hypothetical protein